MRIRRAFAPAGAPLQAEQRQAAGIAWVAGLALYACVSDADPPLTPAAAGSGSAGMSSTGSAGGGAVSPPPTGASGGGGAAAFDYAGEASFATGTPCFPVTQALLTDFTYVPPAGVDAGVVDAAAPAATGVAFGDFSSRLSGSIFTYPGAGSPYPVRSDVRGNDWHLTGSIGAYSGFGLSFANCYRVDASAYQGIAFTISGSVPMGNSITLNVNTAANEISHVWMNRNTNPATPLVPNAGRCIPAASQYDSTCGAPNFTVPVSAEPTTIEVRWAQLANGRPSASVDPTELTNISWNFPPPLGVDSPNPTTYDVDLTIDDLRFIENP